MSCTQLRHYVYFIFLCLAQNYGEGNSLSPRMQARVCKKIFRGEKRSWTFVFLRPSRSLHAWPTMNSGCSCVSRYLGARHNNSAGRSAFCSACLYCADIRTDFGKVVCFRAGAWIINASSSLGHLKWDVFAANSMTIFSDSIFIILDLGFMGKI